MAVKISVLSAGAVKPGLVKVVKAFHRASSHDVAVTFATAPAIRNRLMDGEQTDIVIAPADLVDGLIQADKAYAEDRCVIGRIGVGVMVRADVASPRITTVEDFQSALLNAESIVYNQASTGTYLDNLFERLGVVSQVQTKTTRYMDFAAVLHHIRKGRGNEIGLGATTVIIENAGHGIKFVGPLPAEIQNYTTYVAAVVAKINANDRATALLRHLASSSANLLFTGAGIE